MLVPATVNAAIPARAAPRSFPENREFDPSFALKIDISALLQSSPREPGDRASSGCLSSLAAILPKSG
jgi:hypothetical protein